MGHATAARSIPLRCSVELSDLRSRSDLQRGGHLHGKERRHHSQANQLSKPVAERRRRTLGGTLQKGFAGSRHRFRRTASAALMNEYISYYHEDRTHIALEKETPAGRVTAKNSGAGSRIIAMPRLGGLHHRYDLAAHAFALEIFNKVEKKRRRSASVDLSRDPQHRFDCYPQPPKTSVPSRKSPGKPPPHAIIAPVLRPMKFWRDTTSNDPPELERTNRESADNNPSPRRALAFEESLWPTSVRGPGK